MPMSNGMNFQAVPLSELAKGNTADKTGHEKPVVLVVDDEPVIADTLAAILSTSGFVAMAAHSGEKALEIARVVPPNLLLTDVVMPNMNGINLAIAIQDTIQDCAVLLFSGQAATADLLAEAHRMGRNFTVLQKPLHPKELLARISESLDVPAQSAA
jgi:DNA-binding response OmpR family regulator